jgi:putative transposase
VQQEAYLLQLYRYIELNPVRAGMVMQPSDYVWSSYQINALGKESELCTPHSCYLALDRDATKRQANYRDLFKSHVDGELLENIRTSVNKGLVFGNSRFESEIENLTGRRMTTSKVGRPVGGRKADILKI